MTSLYRSDVTESELDCPSDSSCSVAESSVAAHKVISLHA